MRRIRITIAYDGTAYCGFQLQPDQPTIEGELNRALSALTHETIEVIGASRTDSGVHAAGNAAVFDTQSTIPAEKFALAAAPFLPADIRITGGIEVPQDWHPRRVSCEKTYRYSFSCGMVEDPAERLYTAFSRRVPDLSRMREAAAYLIGEHDFTSFANPSSQVLLEGGSAVRTITDITIEAVPPMPGHLNTSVNIYVSGNGFLYNMVRIIAGTLMSVGTGLWEPERVEAALKARDRTKAGPTAEARGLTLCEIRYPQL